MKKVDIAILGGGASGLMCASFLKNKKFLIIEKNPYIGAKIKVSGGGKCNITNKKLSKDNYLGEKEFIEDILKRFTNKDLLSWIKSRGCEPILRKKYQYFCPNSSKELIDIFLKEIDNRKIFLNCEIKDILNDGENFYIKTSKKDFLAKVVIVSTGGVSFKKLGATDIGYKIAQNFGHKIVPLKPALVGFTVQKGQSWFKELSGISFKVKVYIKDKIFEDNILFTHKGISGPAILNTSLYWDRGYITIDFLNGKKIENFLKYKHKQISTILPFPKRFTKSFLKSIDMEDKKVLKLTKEDIEKLKILEKYIFSPAGTFGFERAEVTKGGVCTKEIDKNSLMSKLRNNLFFIGEVLDVTGELGGYNFQWSFSSAIKVARYLNEFFRDC